MESDQEQKVQTKNSTQQKIKPFQDKPLKEFDFYLNNKDKQEIFSYFKFQLKDLIDPDLWSQIQHNEVIEDDRNSLEFLDEKNQDFQRFIKDKHYTFNILDEIKVEVIFRPKLINHSDNHITLTITYFLDILNEDKFNFNGVLHIYSRGYCNNLREKLIQRKRTFYVSSQSEQYQIDINKKLFPDKGDEVLWEIRFEQENLLAQEEGLPIGLKNLGVTCYMNSYLQTMFHIKQFRKYVADLDNENKQDSFLFALQSLFYQMQKMKKAPANTGLLVKSFNWDIQQIFTQQDVQEFSFMFFEAIEQKSKQQGIQIDIIKELFEGKMESFIKCLNVNYESTREEIFTDVQLVIKEQDNIYQALDNHFQSIILDGDNKYATEDYGKQDAEKGLRFKKIPKVLTFQLNRFEYSYEFEQNRKINDKFEFYEEIDLEQYCQDKTQSYKYLLFGVNSHIGLQSDQGHYKTFIKIENQWLEFDDSDVIKVDFDYVKQNSYGGRYNDVCLDTRNFGLKLKKRLVYGHAYRLIYIQKQHYDQIIKNNDQKVEFSQNIKKINDPLIQQIEFQYFQKEHFDLTFTFKDSFVNKDTGLNGLFIKKYHLDDFRQYLTEENVIKLQLKKTINKKNFFSIIEKTFDLENNCSDIETQSESEEFNDTKMNRFYSLYIYSQRYGCLQLFDFNNFVENCDEQSYFYFYIDIHNQQLDNEKLVVIKNFDLQNLTYQVEDIFSVDGDNKMDCVLERLELKEPYICRKQQYQNKYEDIDEKQSISTNQASSEIIIILIRNAEVSDWQIFIKFYNKMYFKILIDIQYKNQIQKFYFDINKNLKEQIHTIKQIFNIPQEELVIIHYLRRNNSRRYTIKEKTLEDDCSSLLSQSLFRNPQLYITKESDIEDLSSKFTIYIFGFFGIQYLSDLNQIDDIQNLQELKNSLEQQQILQKYKQILNDKLGEIRLEILKLEILSFQQTGCYQPPIEFANDQSYNFILVPTLQYQEENSIYQLLLQFQEDGQYNRQYPILNIFIPNLTKENFINFLKEFFTLISPYGQKQLTSDYKIRDNIEKFQYINDSEQVQVLDVRYQLQNNFICKFQI